jgi:hypothetical protein
MAGLYTPSGAGGELSSIQTVGSPECYNHNHSHYFIWWVQATKFRVAIVERYNL